MPDAALLEAALTADGPAERSRGASPPLDFSVDPAWHDVFYDEPSEKRVRSLNTFLQAHPAQVVRLYHGTGASVPVLVKGLLPTSEGRRRSLQSAPGYVYLSVYPGMARTFGEMGYPGEAVAVYAVDIPVNQLRADLDQLRNQRLWAQRKVGDTLAESLAFGRGARVRGKIPPHRISLYQPVERMVTSTSKARSREEQIEALRFDRTAQPVVEILREDLDAAVQLLAALTLTDEEVDRFQPNPRRGSGWAARMRADLLRHRADLLRVFEGHGFHTNDHVGFALTPLTHPVTNYRGLDAGYKALEKMLVAYAEGEGPDAPEGGSTEKAWWAQRLVDEGFHPDIAQRVLAREGWEHVTTAGRLRLMGQLDARRRTLAPPVDQLPVLRPRKKQRGERTRPSLEARLLALRPALAQAAQEVYDEWQPDEEEGDVDLGFGGICDQVANAMSGVIASQVPDAEIEDGGWEGDDHAYLIVNRGAERYMVDIPPGVYERGGGYSWTKIEGVTIEADDVIVEKV